MAAKKSIEYEIQMLGIGNLRYLKPVKGYPIVLPVSGQFALRQREEHMWDVDHIETGCRVAEGLSRQEAIDAALLVAKREGEEGFAAAIKEAKKRRESIPQ